MNSLYKFVRGVSCQLKLHNVPSMFIYQQSRFAALYGPNSLGVDKFKDARQTHAERSSQMLDNFRSKMTDFTKDDSNNMIFTEDLKTMLHVCTNSDIELLEKMLKKFSTQNKELRFGSYVFGPVIMRLYYLLDLPNEAYKLFKDPELQGMFDQMMSFHILMDLLYKHNLHAEVLDVFEHVKNVQVAMRAFPRHILVLTMGSLYKQNTEESLKQATKIWKELTEVGNQPMRRAITFVAGLALNQGAPHIALEILSTLKNQSYYTVQNLKIYALADLNRPDDAFPIIRSSLEFDGPREIPQTLTQEVIEHLQASTERSGKSDIKREFSQLQKALLDRNAIDKDKTIDDLLSKEVVMERPTMRPDYERAAQLQHSFSNRRPEISRRFPSDNPRNQQSRQGLSDRY